MKFLSWNLIKSRKKIAGIYLLSILIRVVIAIIQIFYLSIGSFADNASNQLLFNLLEPYLDYKYYYEIYAYEFIHGGWIPYISPTFYDSMPLPYLYPPFFLYIISIPALFSVDLIFLPLFLADILLPFLIYKILITLKSQKVAEWGFLATALCPLSIFYNGGLFLNTSIVTIFFVMSLYYITIKRFRLAIAMLSISFLFKQIVLFSIFPLLLYVILQESENKGSILIYFKNIVVYCGILIGIIFIGSLPWILLDPLKYLTALSLGQFPTLNPEFKSPALNWPIQWYSFLISLGAPYWLLYFVGFLNFTLLGIFIVEIVSLYFIYYWNQNKTLDWLKILDLIVYIAILSHLFTSRGVYKYYFTFHVPLIVLWICFHFYESLEAKSSNRTKYLFIFITISLIVLFIYRLIYLLLIWTIFFLMLRKNLKLNKKYEKKMNNICKKM